MQKLAGMVDLLQPGPRARRARLTASVVGGLHEYVHFDPLLSPADADAMIGCASASAATVCTRRNDGERDRPGPRAAPRRGAELLRRAACSAPGTAVRAGRAHQLLPRDVRLRQRGAHRRHRAVPAPRGVRRRGARSSTAGRSSCRRSSTPTCWCPARSSPCTPTCPSSAAPTASSIPQWLIVVMHHSGLLRGLAHADRDRRVVVPRLRRRRVRLLSRRAPTARAVATRCATTPPSCSTPTRVFHGVDRVAPTTPATCRAPPGMQLALRRRRPLGRPRRRRVPSPRYGWDELRFSVSWKAYCFADEAERDAWREHTDDLSLDAILDTLVADLRARGRITGDAAARRPRADADRRVHPLPPAGGRVAGERRGVCGLAKPGISRACSRKC